MVPLNRKEAFYLCVICCRVRYPTVVFTFCGNIGRVESHRALRLSGGSRERPGQRIERRSDPSDIGGGGGWGRGGAAGLV